MYIFHIIFNIDFRKIRVGVHVLAIRYKIDAPVLVLFFQLRLFQLHDRLHVQQQTKRIRTIESSLAAHDICRNSAHLVKVAMPARVQEDFRVHLICTLRNGPNVIVNNSRSEHRHHLRLHRHAVAQNTQVVIIHVGITRLHDFIKLVQNILSRGLDSKDVVHFSNIVTICARIIDEI